MKNHQFSKEIRGKLKPLKGSNNYRGFIGVFSDYAFIIFAIFMTEFSIWMYPISLLIIGARQRALATILHDASHNCLAKSKKINYILGTYFSGYFIGQEFYNYKKSHVNGHHVNLGNREKDPDYQYHMDMGLYKTKNNKEFIFQYFVKPLLFLNIYSYVKYVFKNRMLQYKVAPKQYTIMVVYWIVIFSVLYYFSMLEYLILFWIVPYLTTFSVIGWFIELSEHYPLVHQNKQRLHMTRNRFSHWFERFFVGIHGESYHLTHHLMPSIPYWNIAKAHEIMLLDKEYREINSYMGGIFISSNQQTSIVVDLIQKNSNRKRIDA